MMESENNVQCLKCSSEWHETNIKTLASKEVEGLRIAFKGGHGWRQIVCTTKKCKGVVVRKETDGTIKPFQVNDISTRNEHY